MSGNNELVVRVLPLPEDKFMNSGKQVISGISDRGIANYTPNGLYEITASSNAGGGTQPFVIANDQEQDYWQCDYKNNPNFIDSTYPEYTQNPYTGGNETSPYQGGGDPGNKWSTPVGNNRIIDVRGEWIQVHIPYKVYIQQYSIQTPTFEQYNTFPYKFMLVGSNDGTTWIQIDQKNLKTTDLPTGANTKKTYDINSAEKYSYFRLIIIGMGPHMDTVKIQELVLYGTTMILVNPNTTPETFVTLNRSVGLHDKASSNILYNSINLYEPQYGKYTLDKQLSDNEKQIKQVNETNTPFQYPINIDNMLKTTIFAGILLTSVFFYKIRR